jgi:hypothetical protein
MPPSRLARPAPLLHRSIFQHRRRGFRAAVRPIPVIGEAVIVA